MGRWSLSGEMYMVTNKDREPIAIGDGVEMMPFWVSVTRARVEQTCLSGRFELTLEGLGLDPVTRKPVDIESHTEFSVLEDENLLHTLREALRRMVLAEVDKCLLHHGKRVFDPHGGE